MKYIYLIVFGFLITACAGDQTSHYESDYSHDYSYEEDLYEGNPYSEGSGHYAGFEWAERKGVDGCGGNSQSFIEGCEEYLRQTGQF